MFRTEDFRELQQFFRVPSETSQLRENQSGNVAPPKVGKHALGLRKSHDRLPADCVKVIHLFDVPTSRLGVQPCASFVMFWALAANLILCRNTNPTSARLSIVILLL